MSDIKINNSVAGVESVEHNGLTLITNTQRSSVIPLHITKEQISDEKCYTAFVKNVELQIRKNDIYSAYKRYLMEDLDPPLNHCMMYSNITGEDVKIEMHHGVIFTLFDCVEIVFRSLIKRGEKVTSSYLAHVILKEHMEHRIQVIMLSESVHKEMHVKKKGFKPKFIDYKSCHGDIVSFLEKYYDGLSFKHLNKIRKYMDEYKENVGKEDSFFEENITKWTDDLMG